MVKAGTLKKKNFFYVATQLEGGGMVKALVAGSLKKNCGLPKSQLHYITSAFWFNDVCSVSSIMKLSIISCIHPLYLKILIFLS